MLQHVYLSLLRRPRKGSDSRVVIGFAQSKGEYPTPHSRLMPRGPNRSEAQDGLSVETKLGEGIEGRTLKVHLASTGCG